ncbi:MAG: hypothetical protein Q8O84_01905 [Nanoarchaeota archaeon]|nr:hypothetical protein [Nanoarchaeota archaeon]
MKDYQEISDKIINYIKLKKELKGLSAEALQNSKEYRQFLAIDGSLKNQIFDGGELMQILDEVYQEYGQDIKEKEDKEKQINKLLNNLEGIIKGKEGTIIKEIKEKINKYKQTSS